MKRDRDERGERRDDFVENVSSQKKNPPDELSHTASKKTSPSDELFVRKFRILPVFSFVYMI